MKTIAFRGETLRTLNPQSFYSGNSHIVCYLDEFGQEFAVQSDHQSRVEESARILNEHEVRNGRIAKYYSREVKE
jgi:hypothetical protein